MKYYGKAEAVTRQIIEAFERGDVPQALAQVFIHHGANRPQGSWSWSNQLLCALSGTADARGFRQWKEVNRHVKKGAKAIYILIPLIAKRKDADADADKPDTFLYGFKSAPVFRYEDTEGEALNDGEAREFVDALPLIEVARAWGLDVATYNGGKAPYLGYYRPGQAIALGVENLSTWAHELMHAADHRAGGLTAYGKPYNEIVAELGGAALLRMIGREQDADLGGAFDYVKRYAAQTGKDLAGACIHVLNRIGRALALVMETAEAESAAALST